jgi:hypothetical protein
LLNYYLVESHNAVDMAQKQNLIEKDAHEQVKVVLQVQQFIENQLGSFAQELAQLDQSAQQFKPQPQMPPDSSLQVAQMNNQLQGQALQQRAQSDQAKLQQQIQLGQAKLQQDAQSEQAKLAAKQAELSQNAQLEQLRQMAESQRDATDMQTRERMNTADNDTAKMLAAAEIESGEKVRVSTGTGINPNP